MVLAEIGARLKRTRLGKNLPQNALAEQAGCSRLVVARAEHGAPVTTQSLAMILRALGCVGELDKILPAPPLKLDPMQVLAAQKKQRRRARRKQVACADTE
ncbi:MAG: helix-turn-helix domain-containing protein [Rhodospirillales bacterium]